LARFKNRKLDAVRFSVLPPPFNRWLIFIDRRQTSGNHPGDLRNAKLAWKTDSFFLRTTP